jgi:hypothetical protein
MNQLIFEGDPKLIETFEKDLIEELERIPDSAQIPVETKTIQASLAPGEFGFGEEIRQVLVGIAEVLKAGKDAVNNVSKGLAKRLVQRKLSIDVDPNGHISIKAAGDLTDVPEVTEKFAELIRIQIQKLS